MSLLQQAQVLLLPSDGALASVAFARAVVLSLTAQWELAVEALLVTMQHPTGGRLHDADPAPCALAERLVVALSALNATTAAHALSSERLVAAVRSCPPPDDQCVPTATPPRLLRSDRL